MQHFLEKIAQHLIQTYGDDISELCLVLPNKRAGLFLKKHISQLIHKPLWMPEIKGTEELMEQLTPFQQLDNTHQLFELYHVYQSIENEPESFHEFSKWGQILLHDFNEIDRYLIPADKLFTHVNEARILEVWNLGEKEITDFQQRYLKFWEQLGRIYNAFTTYLEQKGLAYQGMIYRSVAAEIIDDPETFISQKVKWRKVVFIGFNALNKAEEVLITLLKEHGKAAIFWDADRYYLDDDLQESGIFLRRFQQKNAFQPFSWISDHFNTTEKNIFVYGISQNIGQAKYAGTILNQLKTAENFRDTAVVLSDENLLLPMLQSIPDKVDAVNVTMGYPLKNTPIHHFFETYFVTLLNAERFGKGSSLTYHYKDLLKLFSLAFSEILFGGENCKKIRQHIVQHNWVFIRDDQLDWINANMDLPFNAHFEISQVLKMCLTFVRKGKAFYQEKAVESETSHALDQEYLFQFAKLFNQLTVLTDQYPFLDNGKDFYALYKQLVNANTIELFGEPLKGLQVMGMLETRNIDFDNVILLSANEGTLPAGKTFNSFIPYDIKKAFQLPTHMEKDAIYAYHFYRLVQNAKNLHVLYNTETNEFGSGEQSRFITQIEHELVDKSNINWKKQLITYPMVAHEKEKKEVLKTPEIMQKILQLFEKGISPTALITYINCPLDFYHNYVLGLREMEEVEETASAATFGTFLHQILETLYQPFIHKNLSEDVIQQLMKQVPDTTHAVFSAHFGKKTLQEGKNMLTYTVAQDYVRTFLTQEIQAIRQHKTINIQALEKELKTSVKLTLGGTEYQLNLRGMVDRIDNVGETTRIIDYKTGLVTPTEIKITSTQELLVPHKKNKALQLLIYAYLYAKGHASLPASLHAGIITFRKLSSGVLLFNGNGNHNIDAQQLDQFERLLENVIKDLLDISKPFVHNTDAKYCKFCS